MAKKEKIVNHKVKSKVSRKGIHAKTKMSKTKSSKLYSKPYRQQGR